MRNSNTAILLRADDWEGLYVDGALIWEDHSLDDPQEWVRWVNTYMIEELIIRYLEGDDLDKVYEEGSFPSDLEGFKNDYN